MEKRYIDLIHELQDCETARNFVLARAEAAEADARECRAERARYSDAMTERLAGVEAERDALRAELAALRFTCEDVVSNLEAPIRWTDRDSIIAATILRGTLDATA